MLIFVKLKSLSLNSRLSVSVDLISLMDAWSLIDCLFLSTCLKINLLYLSWASVNLLTRSTYYFMYASYFICFFSLLKMCWSYKPLTTSISFLACSIGLDRITSIRFSFTRRRFEIMNWTIGSLLILFLREIIQTKKGYNDEKN